MDTSQIHSVAPAIASSPGWNYHLSNLDLINWIPRPQYHELVLFFRDCISPNHGERELHEGLKSSLSRALCEFPVLAGRIHGEPFKLEVSVNSQGVSYIESRSDARLDEWSDIRQCPMSIDFSLSGHAGHADLDLSQMPLLQVQVTTFRCGGVAIGFHFLHMIMDGFSLVNFLARWSEIHRGASVIERAHPTTTLLKARSPPRVDASVPFLVENAQPDAAGFDFGASALEEHESMVLRMEKEAVDSCAREIESSTNFGYGKATTFEAVSALLWSSITAAKALPGHLDTSYMLPVNLRSKGRFVPQIPEDYFGNALIPCQAYAASAGQVASDKSFAAKLIHERIISADHRSMRSAVDWLELNSPPALLAMLHWKRGLLSTSLGRFPVYGVDFGWRGGALSQLCLLPTALPPSFVALFPAPAQESKTKLSVNHSRSIDIHIRLPKTHKEKLLNDAFFTRYFSDKEIVSWSKSLCNKAMKLATKK